MLAHWRLNREWEDRGKTTKLTVINPELAGFSWPPLIDNVVPVDPTPNHQYGPSRGPGLLLGSLHSPPRTDAAETFNNEAKRNTSVDESICIGDDSADCSCSNPLENDVNSLDLNSDLIEIIEDEFLKHRNKDRKSKKLNSGRLTKSHDSVSLELELTKKVSTAVGFQLDGHDRMLRSEIEGEGVSKLKKVKEELKKWGAMHRGEEHGEVCKLEKDMESVELKAEMNALSEEDSLH
ncbi:hypothetical protein L1887_23481 [Cichorium endivia]|nr:hypothetical protein L1887_23481 [Cichorium endivia]